MFQINVSCVIFTNSWKDVCVWVNNDRNLIFGWIISLTFKGLNWITESFKDEYWLGQCWKHLQLQNEQQSREKQEPRTLKPTSVLNNDTIHLAQHKAQSHWEQEKLLFLYLKALVNKKIIIWCNTAFMFYTANAASVTETFSPTARLSN